MTKKKNEKKQKRNTPQVKRSKLILWTLLFGKVNVQKKVGINKGNSKLIKVWAKTNKPLSHVIKDVQMFLHLTIYPQPWVVLK